MNGVLRVLANWGAGIVFGGYVRDILMGEKPKDIDIMIEEAYYKSLVLSFVRKGYFVREVKSEDQYGRAMSNRKRYSDNHILHVNKIEVIDNKTGEHVFLDIVLISSGVDFDFNNFPSFLKPDFECNRMFFKTGEILDVHKDSVIRTSLIGLEQIRTKTLRLPHGIDQRRVDKMLEKGFVLEGSMSNVTVESASDEEKASLNDPNCPVEILEKFSNDLDNYVRHCVVQNPNCPVKIIEKLSNDSDWIVRSNVAKNPNCPVEILKKLSNDSDWNVRLNVAKNPNCPVEILEILEKLSDDSSYYE